MKLTFKRIKTADGLELQGLLYEPAQASREKVLVHIHGMAGNFYENAFIDNLANTLTQNKVSLCVFNNRGAEFVKDMYKGARPNIEFERVGNMYELFSQSEKDIAAIIDFVERQGYNEIHLSGHSLGAPKIAHYQAKTDDKRVASLIFVSPADMLALARDEDDFEKKMTLAEELVNKGRGKELLPDLIWDEYMLSAQTYVSLFADESKAAIFNFFRENDKYDTLNQIKTPVFAVMGRQDNAVTVPIEKALELIKKNCSNSPKVVTKLLGNANHGYHGDGQALADSINTWILPKANA